MTLAPRNGIKYILNRLREPTSWAGIFVFLQEIGVMIAPEFAAELRTTGVSLASLVLFIMKEGRAND